MNDDTVLEIKTDENLLEWFQLNIDNGEVPIFAEIKDFEGPLQFSPIKRRCHPTVRDRVTTTQATDEEENPSHKKVTKKGRKLKTKIDEEDIYSETESLAALTDSSYGSDLAASSDCFNRVD